MSGIARRNLEVVARFGGLVEIILARKEPLMALAEKSSMRIQIRRTNPDD